MTSKQVEVNGYAPFKREGFHMSIGENVLDEKKYHKTIDYIRLEYFCLMYVLLNNFAIFGLTLFGFVPLLGVLTIPLMAIMSFPLAIHILSILFCFVLGILEGHSTREQQIKDGVTFQPFIIHHIVFCDKLLWHTDGYIYSPEIYSQIPDWLYKFYQKSGDEMLQVILRNCQNSVYTGGLLMFNLVSYIYDLIANQQKKEDANTIKDKSGGDEPKKTN